MATVSINYATVASLACTLTTLGVGAYRASVAADNATTNKYVDAILGGSIQVGAITLAGTVEVYVYGSWDGTEFSGGLDGTNTAITWGTTPTASSVNGASMLALIAVLDVATTDDNNDIKIPPKSVAAAFGGVMPREWGVVVKNNTDIALHGTGTNNVIEFTGIKYDSL